MWMGRVDQLLGFLKESIYLVTAAFERVSRLNIKPHDFDEQIDIRNTILPEERPPPGDYNPLDHREIKTPIKPWMAYFNVLRSLFGPGLLIMPLAISQAGLVLGPILAFFYGGLLIHTHIMLLNCLTEISRQLRIPCISYRYGFRLAVLHGPPFVHVLGKHGPQIIATFMIMSQLGVCTISIILTSDSVRDLMDWQSNDGALLAMLGPYLILEFFMKTLSIVSYVSFVGNFLNMIGLGLVFYQIFSDPKKVYTYANTELLPLCFACGAFLCNLSAVGVILAMEKNLKQPRIMTSKFGVIPVGLMLPTVVTVLVGTFGYWSFGTMEENVLRVLPLDEITVLTILSVYLVSVTFAYPIQCYPAIAVMVEVVKYYNPKTTPNESSLRKVETYGRPLFVLLTFIICYFVPFQAPFVAFTGNLCTSMMSLFFPALMDTCLRYPDRYGKYDVHLIKNLVIMFIGIVDWIIGALLCGYIIHIRLLSRASPNSHGYF